MILLAIGVLAFAGLHLVKSLAPGLRTQLQQRFTENGYKGIFSLLVLGSMALIVFGWRGAEPQFLYSPLPGLRTAGLALLVLAFLLMVVSARPSRLRRLVRHPQLTGVALWGLAHLLLNGDSRSLLLFGGMLVWAVAEICCHQSPRWRLDQGGGTGARRRYRQSGDCGDRRGGACVYPPLDRGGDDYRPSTAMIRALLQARRCASSDW